MPPRRCGGSVITVDSAWVEVRVIGGLDVVVTAPYALGATLLGDVVTRFIARYPDIRVDADFSNRNVDIVAEGFDLAVRGDPGVRSDSSLTIKKLASATVGFNAAPSYIARTGTPRSVGGQTARALRLLDALRGFPLYPK